MRDDGESRRAAREAARQAFLATDTGRGVCPACGSRNIHERLEGGAGGWSCCLVVALFPLSLLMLPALRGGGTRHRLCLVCGHRWTA